MKTRIVEHLGQSVVMLPALVTQGLIANDRAKVCVSPWTSCARASSRALKACGV